MAPSTAGHFGSERSPQAEASHEDPSDAGIIYRPYDLTSNWPTDKIHSVPQPSPAGKGTPLAQRIAAAAAQALRNAAARKARGPEQFEPLNLCLRDQIAVANEQRARRLRELLAFRKQGYGAKFSHTEQALGSSRRNWREDGSQEEEAGSPGYQRGQLGAQRPAHSPQVASWVHTCGRCRSSSRLSTSPWRTGPRNTEQVPQTARQGCKRGQLLVLPKTQGSQRVRRPSRWDQPPAEPTSSATLKPLYQARSYSRTKVMTITRAALAAVFFGVLFQLIGFGLCGNSSNVSSNGNRDHYTNDDYEKLFAGIEAGEHEAMNNKDTFMTELPTLNESTSWIEKASWLSDDKGRDLTKRNADMKFTSYDCSQPQKLEDRALDDDQFTCTDDAIMVSQTNETYQVLIKETKQKISGTKCVIRDTRSASYCGHLSHGTTFDLMGYTNVPKLLTERECRNLRDKQNYKQPDGQIVQVKKNEWFNGFYFEVGNSKWGASNFGSSGGRVDCKGGEWKHQGKTYHGMVVSHSYTIGFFDDELEWNGDYMLSTSDNIRLIANPRDHGFEGGEATYIWLGGEDWCPMGVSKEATGIMAKDERGREVFMSTDGNLVRLIKGKQETMCGRLIYGTNYVDVFMADADTLRPFSRRIEASGVSLSTYVNARDDFLYNHLVDKINAEMKSVLTGHCENRRTKARQDYFLQHKNPGIVTYGFGNGTFAATAGEVMYFYTCRPEVVTARETSQCYDALPVSLAYDSRLLKQFNATTRWYLEPLTRRLTRFASVVSCTIHFSAKYKSLTGKWISVSPEIRSAPRPKLTAKPIEILTQLHADKDFSKGGIYSKSDMKAWEAYAFTGRIRDSVSSRLALTVSQNYQQGSGSAHFQTPSSWFHSQLMGFISFLDRWGKIAAIVISLSILWQLINKIISMAYGAFQIYQSSMGFSWRLLWSLCPTMFLIRGHGARPDDVERAENDDDDDQPEPARLTRGGFRTSLQGLYRRVAKFNPDEEPARREEGSVTSRRGSGGHEQLQRRRSNSDSGREGAEVKRRYKTKPPPDSLPARRRFTEEPSRRTSYQGYDAEGSGDERMTPKRTRAARDRARTLPPAVAGASGESIELQQMSRRSSLVYPELPVASDVSDQARQGAKEKKVKFFQASAPPSPRHPASPSTDMDSVTSYESRV